MHRTRSPLTLGWEAARANALPALIIQALMLMLLLSFYISHTAFALFSQLAELKRTGGILFVIVASITAGGHNFEIFFFFFFFCRAPPPRVLFYFFFFFPALWCRIRCLVIFVFKYQDALLG